MTTCQVRYIDGQARKPLGDNGREHAIRNAYLSRQLASAGLHTPVGTYDPHAHEFVYPWIAGRCARDVIGELRQQAPHLSWTGVSPRWFSKLLRPVAHLHKTATGSLSLRPLDPWRRIEPRLQRRHRRAADEKRVRSLYDSLRRLEICARLEGRNPKAVPVHGDLHVGQLLFEADAQIIWLIDLDDIALGAPESDLGNFVAHLCTSRDLYTGNVLAGFKKLADIVVTAYGTWNARAPDACQLKLHGAIALLRRGLKLAEQSVEGTVDPLILAAAESLTRELANDPSSMAARYIDQRRPATGGQASNRVST